MSEEVSPEFIIWPCYPLLPINFILLSISKTSTWLEGPCAPKATLQLSGEILISSIQHALFWLFYVAIWVNLLDLESIIYKEVGSKMWTQPLKSPATTKSPFLLQSRARISYSNYFSLQRIIYLFSRSQILILLSPPDVTIQLFFGLIAKPQSSP